MDESPRSICVCVRTKRKLFAYALNALGAFHDSEIAEWSDIYKKRKSFYAGKEEKVLSILLFLDNIISFLSHFWRLILGREKTQKKQLR